MTTAGTPLEPPARWSGRTGRIRSLARARPVATFVAIVLAIAWPAFIIPLLVGAPLDPSKLLVTLVVMLATATLITSWTEGRAGVRALFGGVTRWRIGVAGYLLVLGAMPVLTLAVAAVTGTLQSPEGGWVGMIGNYLFTTVIYGALILNLWEETAWAGFVQSRLMARRGLLVGSLLTAVPFVAIHLPLSFEDAGSAGSVWRPTSPCWSSSRSSSATSSAPCWSTPAAVCSPSACYTPRSTPPAAWRRSTASCPVSQPSSS